MANEIISDNYVLSVFTEDVFFSKQGAKYTKFSVAKTIVSVASIVATKTARTLPRSTTPS